VPVGVGQVGPSAGGGSSASSILRQAVASLTNAQIKALPTTPVTIIAAPGANKLLVPHVALAHMKWVGNYTNINATSSISIDTAGNFLTSLAEDTLGGVTALLAGGGPDGSWVPFVIQQIAQAKVTTATPAVNPHFHHGVADSGSYDADIVNVPLTISMENVGDGPLTGGNASNVLQISVAYYVLNTITGVYE